MSDPARAIPIPPALSDHPPVTDWVHDFDHTDPRWTENPFPIWEELRAASPGGSHRSLPRLLHADHLSGGEGNRLRHRAFLLAPRHRARRPAGVTQHRAADHLRSAGAQAGQAIAAAAVHARRHEEAGAAGSRHLQRADRRVHRRRQMRRRGALHQAHSGSRHRPHARHPRKGRRPLHQVDPRNPRARHQGRRTPDARGPGDDRLFPRPYRGSASRTRPTI